jgi:hypothetical protein
MRPLESGAAFFLTFLNLVVCAAAGRHHGERNGFDTSA